MATKHSYTVQDYDGEKSNMQFNGLAILADGSNLAAQQTLWNVLFAAIQGITRIANFDSEITSLITRGGQSPNIDPEAQREEKWLVTYEDVTAYLDAPLNTVPNPGYHKIFNQEIPVGDLSLRENNSEIVYSVAGGGVDPLFDTFVGAFEAVVVSPYGGEADVIEIRSVGRNT